MTVAKVILHGGFPCQSASVSQLPVCAQTPGNASPTYLPSTHSRSPGASEPPKKPQRLRQRVEESLSRARQLLRKVIVAGSGSKSRSLPPAFQPPPLSNSSCC